MGPVVCVAKHRLDAALDEGFHAVLFNRFFPMDAKLLFNFHFHRQSVGIPSGFPRNVIAAHRFVARDEIFDDARQHRSVVGFSVGGGRALIEHERLCPFALLHRLLEDASLLPKIEDCSLFRGEIHCGVHLFESFGHGRPPYRETSWISSATVPRFSPFLPPCGRVSRS